MTTTQTLIDSQRNKMDGDIYSNSVRATILAALRLFQVAHPPSDHFDDAPPLTSAQLDELCEALSCESGIIMLDSDTCPEHGPHNADYCPTCKERAEAAFWKQRAIEACYYLNADIFTDAPACKGKVLNAQSLGRYILNADATGDRDAQKVKLVCATCGSDDIRTDAWARWDVDTQEMVLSSTMDQSYCGVCDGECNTREIGV